MTQTYDQWAAQTLELGRSVAARYRRPFQVDGRPMTMLEMQAILWWGQHSGDALIDQLIVQFNTWSEDHEYSDFSAKRQEAGRTAGGDRPEA